MEGEELEQDEAAANAQGDGFGAGGRAELAEDRGNVEFCGVIGNVEAARNLFVTQAGSEHLQDFALAAGQRFGEFGKRLRVWQSGRGDGGDEIGRMQNNKAGGCCL